MWCAIVFLIALALILYGTSKLKINAFFVMIFAAFFYGLVCGIDPNQVISAVKTGFGDMFAKTGLIYISGIIIGILMDKTGAAISIANFILRIIGINNAPIAISLSGYMISIPINCDSGFIIISPMTKSISQSTKFSLCSLNIILACGLYSTHTLVPPTAGPTSIAAMLDVDLGKMIFFGLIVALVSTISGLFFSKKICSKYENEGNNSESKSIRVEDLPNPLHSFLPILYPLVMICLNTISNFGNHPFGEGILLKIFSILGDPSIALIGGVLLAFTLVKKSSFNEATTDWIEEALRAASTIVLINSAAGAFAEVLSISPLVDIISKSMLNVNLGLFTPFLIAALIKIAQGSTTVSMVTTAGIMSPLCVKLGLDPCMCALAIGAGAMIISHTNDSFFWVVTQFTGMDVKTALRTFSPASAVAGVSAFAVVLLLDLFF